MPSDQRQAYLLSARKAFEKSLSLDPNNANAHNGMGNIHYFEGHFDEAIKEHDTALKLTNGKYPAAYRDKKLAIKAKNGEIPFDP